MYKASRNDRSLNWTAGMALQPEPTTLGHLWDGGGHGAGGAAETPVQAEPDRKKHCHVYFRIFVLLLLTTLSKYIPLMDAAREQAHTSSCERVPVPISLFPNT